MAHGISLPSGGRAVPRGPKQLLALRGDEHLVDRVRRGDETAFEVVYERHVHGLLSFCRHMLGSREEAEDAVQQTFTAAHRDLLRDDREIKLKAWLYTIARNRCFSMLRARREEPDDRIATSTDGLADQVQQRADLRELLDDLHDLPEDQRAALVLSEMRDLSHAEVAEILGCRVANVKGLVFRARAGLTERREARDAGCESIRVELANAQGGTLRRGRLRHHLRACPGCSAYLADVRRQRQMMALILPVVPSMGLKSGVLAAVGLGGGAAGGGGAAAGGGLLASLLPASGATVAKVAVVGALVAGGSVGGQAVFNGDSSAPAAQPGSVQDPVGRSADAPFGAPFGVAEPAEAAKPDADDGSRPGASEEAREAALEKKATRQKSKSKRGRGLANRPVTPGTGPQPRGVKPVKGRAPQGVAPTDRVPQRAQPMVPEVPTQPRERATPPPRNERALGRTTPAPPPPPPAPAPVEVIPPEG